MNHSPYFTEKTTAPVDFKRRREPAEIYRDAFRFLRSEWRPLSRLTLIYVLPFFLLYAAAQIFIQMKLTGSAAVLQDMEPEKLVKEAWPIYKNLLIILIFNIFVQSLFMSVLFSYLHGYIALGKGAFTWRQVTPILFSNALVALSASLAVALISFSGAIFFILPGLILANSLSLTVFIAIYERTGVYPALLRSFFLTRNGWWATLVINLTAILIIWGVNILVTLPLSATLPAAVTSGAAGTGEAAGALAATGAATGALNTAASTTPELALWQWIYLGASLVISSLFSVFGYLFQAFQYFNLSIKSSNPES